MMLFFFFHKTSDAKFFLMIKRHFGKAPIVPRHKSLNRKNDLDHLKKKKKVIMRNSTELLEDLLLR